MYSYRVCVFFMLYHVCVFSLYHIMFKVLYRFWHIFFIRIFFIYSCIHDVSCFSYFLYHIQYCQIYEIATTQILSWIRNLWDSENQNGSSFLFSSMLKFEWSLVQRLLFYVPKLTVWYFLVIQRFLHMPGKYNKTNTWSNNIYEHTITGQAENATANRVTM